MPYSYKAKGKNIRQLNNYMLSKTLGMFQYSGLPETIPHRELERLLQSVGHVFVTEVDGELYALEGTQGGEGDAYGQPTTYQVANTFLKLSKTYDIKEDGVLFRSDDMEMGLLPLYEKHNTFIAENEISLMLASYNSRSQKIISAPDDKTKESAEMYLRKLIEGDLSVIGENAFFDGVRLQSTTSGASDALQRLTEFQQYIKASLLIEVGISASFNMKRERLVSSEIEQTEDGLFPLVYNMLRCRREAVAAINAKYGTQIQVQFGSIWADSMADADNQNGAGESDVDGGEGEGTGTATGTTTEINNGQSETQADFNQQNSPQSDAGEPESLVNSEQQETESQPVVEVSIEVNTNDSQPDDATDTQPESESDSSAPEENEQSNSTSGDAATGDNADDNGSEKDEDEESEGK